MSKTFKAFFVGLLSIIVGSVYLFLLPQFYRAAEDRVRDLQPQSAAAVKNGVAGTPVLVEGKISLENEDRYRNLVTYRQGNTINGPDKQPLLTTYDYVTPSLLIDVADGPVRVEEGYLLGHTTQGWQTKLYHYSGLVRGETVIVVGHVTETGTIKADFVAGGTRQAYLLRRIGETWSAYIGGVCAIVIGFFVMVGAIMVWRARARTQHLAYT